MESHPSWLAIRSSDDQPILVNSLSVQRFGQQQETYTEQTQNTLVKTFYSIDYHHVHLAALYGDQRPLRNIYLYKYSD